MSEFSGAPLMIYVPGLKPKPEPRAHRRELFRCLLEGVRRIDPDSATQMQEHDHCFDIIGWTYDFYGEHYDLNLDLAAIDALIQQHSATDEDRAEATSWQRKVLHRIYSVAERTNTTWRNSYAGF
jgi:hypothetical protein